jgi:ABC-type polysaccharide/polyol phosphate export permease
MTAAIADYRSSKELFFNLVLRELRSKYKRSFLGWTWSLINPIALTVVYTIVFSDFLKSKLATAHPSGLNEFSLYLLCGMLPWNFFQASVQGCIGSLVSNGPLIKKTYFPRELLPASNVASNMVSHAIEMGLLLVALLAFGNWRAAAYLPLVVLLMVVTAVFALGLGLALSVLNVYFRDIQHFMALLFLLWFFMTPIVYSLNNLSKHIQLILKLNPMADGIQCFHSAWYYGTFPGGLELGYFVLSALVAFVVGAWVFNRFEGRLAEEL